MTELSQGIGDAQASVWLLCDSPDAGNCCWQGLPALPAQHHLSLGTCRKGGHPSQRGEGSSKWGAEISYYQEAATPKVSTLRQAHAFYYIHAIYKASCYLLLEVKSVLGISGQTKMHIDWCAVFPEAVSQTSTQCQLWCPMFLHPAAKNWVSSFVWL